MKENKKHDMLNDILGGIIGFVVGDALGVPAEFKKPHDLKNNPVTGMESGGVHNQPAGTWSDDTSMVLATMDAFTDAKRRINGDTYYSVMDNFLAWRNEGKYTQYGETFDIGYTTEMALKRYSSGIKFSSCGLDGDSHNGNGSLMRVLPVLFMLRAMCTRNLFLNPYFLEHVNDLSGLTHNHPKSKIACGIYITIAECMIKYKDIKTAIDDGAAWAINHLFFESFMTKDNLLHFYNIRDREFKEREAHTMVSNGYVVTTLESVLWCLLNTDSYRDAVLKAVNLGGDADTVGALTGGLAGLFYGYESIPEEWINAIPKIDYVKDMCKKYNERLKLL